jgi:hypothetical protein
MPADPPHQHRRQYSDEEDASWKNIPAFREDRIKGGPERFGKVLEKPNHSA